MQYSVNEIFYSLQGEATFAGTPSVFIRLQGCAVGCAFCDTKYTWELPISDKVSQQYILDKILPDNKFANFSLEDLIQVIKSYPQCTHVVFTGGEPAIYDLSQIMNHLEEMGYTTQIETSATEKLKIGKNTWVTVSPKINMPGKKPLVKETILRANEIKMPVGKIADIQKLKDFLKEYQIELKSKTLRDHIELKFGLLSDHIANLQGSIKPRVKIWLQPLSCNKKATQICVAAALENNWRVSLQIHKFLDIR